jgi:hypothetical protein
MLPSFFQLKKKIPGLFAFFLGGYTCQNLKPRNREVTDRSHSNYWVIVTSDEISEIRGQLQVPKKGAASLKCRDSARVIAKILNTVEQRLA